MFKTQNSFFGPNFEPEKIFELEEFSGLLEGENSDLNSPELFLSQRFSQGSSNCFPRVVPVSGNQPGTYCVFYKKVVGEGTFSKVYKGYFFRRKEHETRVFYEKDAQPVAVKKEKSSQSQQNPYGRYFGF